MSKISEESGNNLGQQRRTRPAGFTKVATYMGIVGLLSILIFLLMQQLSPSSSMFTVALEDEARFWVMVFVALIAQLSAASLMLVGLIFALVGTVRRERGRWLATAWLFPASIVPLYVVVVWLTT